MHHVKHIGFLSFGHWSASPHSQVRTAADALLQSIELAVAAEELGADGAYFRVHHFARQLASPFPLLAAIGARTSRIEIGTAVIDMRYENPLYMAEDAGAADIIAGGRLQLGISRGSPEQVIDGWRTSATNPPRARPMRTWPAGAPSRSSTCSRARASPSRTRGRCSPIRRDYCASSRIRRVSATASGGARPPTPRPPGRRGLGMNLQSSTLKFDETGEPFHVQQAQADRGVSRSLEGRGPRTHAARLGQPEHLRPGRRSRPRVLRARQPGPRQGRLSRRADAGDLRTLLRCGAGGPGQAARTGRGDRGRGHTAPDGPQSTGRRLQRSCHREHPAVRGTGAGLALTRCATG